MTMELTNIGSYGLITALYGVFTGIIIWGLRKYLSVQISEKVKIGFSKEFKKFSTEQERSSSLSLKHKDLERDVLLKFHRICTDQQFEWFANPFGELEYQIEAYSKMFKSSDEFKKNIISTQGEIYFLLTNDKIVLSSRKLMEHMLDVTFGLEEVQVEYVKTLQMMHAESTKQNGKPEQFNPRVEELQKVLQSRRDQVKDLTYPYLKEYRDLVREHLLI